MTTDFASGVALPQPWTDLVAARKQRRTLRRKIDDLGKTCQSTNGTHRVSECRNCYDEALDSIQSQYTTPQSQKTWFSDRPSVQNSVNTQIQAVRDGKKGPEAIEAALNSEKQAWYRDLLTDTPYLLDFGENDIRKEDLQASLADPECHIDDVIGPVWESFGRTDKWSGKLESFLEKYAAVEEDPAALKALFIAELFMDKTTNKPLDHAKPYLDAYESNTETTLPGVLEKLIEDLSTGKSTRVQRTTLRKRLDELNRAKTAFEQSKAPQVKVQQGATPASGATAPAARDVFETLPACFTCEKEVSRESVISCTLCLLTAQIGGGEKAEGRKLTVYCSPECLTKGQDQHIDNTHACVAGTNCQGPIVSDDGDVDMNMGDDDEKPVLCSLCLEEKEVIMYCTPQCADANLEGHRRRKHGMKTEPDEKSGSGNGVVGVMTSLKAANPDLKMELM